MKALKFCLTILIVSASLLSAAPKGSAQEQSPRPAIHRKAPLSQKRKESPAATQTDTVSPSATAEIKPTEPAIQTPEARNTASKIQEDADTKQGKISESSTDGTGLQIFFTLVTTVATCFLAWFTFQLVTVTRDLHTATKKGTEVAEENVKAARTSAEAARAQLEFTKSANEQNIKIATQGAEAAEQTAQIARLALDVERPYIFIESREVSTKNIKSPGGGGRSFAALLLTTNEVKEEADADYKQISLSFGLRNRGRGVAIVQAVKLRLIEMPSFRRVGILPIQSGKFGIVARHSLITTQPVVGSGEVSFYETFGMAISIDEWQRIYASGQSPIVIVRATYVDTTERLFHAAQRFTWIAGTTLLFTRPTLPRRHR